MATRIRTSQAIKAAFGMYYPLSLTKMTSARYCSTIDCVYSLLGDLNVREKTIKLIGEDKFKEYEQKCDRFKTKFNAMDNLEYWAEQFRQRKDYESFTKIVNQSLWQAQNQHEPIEKPALILLSLLILNTDVEDVKVQRPTDATFAKQRTLTYNPMQNRMQSVDYRDSQTVVPSE